LCRLFICVLLSSTQFIGNNLIRCNIYAHTKSKACVTMEETARSKRACNKRMSESHTSSYNAIDIYCTYICIKFTHDSYEVIELYARKYRTQINKQHN
jgi:hypothetical protein